MNDKKKKNRLWSRAFKLKVVLDIIENELSYSQAARKYNLYLRSGSLNDTQLPAPNLCCLVLCSSINIC